MLSLSLFTSFFLAYRENIEKQTDLNHCNRFTGKITVFMIVVVVFVKRQSERESSSSSSSGNKNSRLKCLKVAMKHHCSSSWNIQNEFGSTTRCMRDKKKLRSAKIPTQYTLPKQLSNVSVQPFLFCHSLRIHRWSVLRFWWRNSIHFGPFFLV